MEGTETKQLNRQTFIMAILALLTTVLWLVFLFLDIKNQTAVTSPDAALAYVKQAGFIYYTIYIDCVLVTVTATLFMATIYHRVKTYHSKPALWGVVFLPIYCVINLFAYGSQVTIIPYLLNQLASQPDQPELVRLITQLTQAWQPVSITAVLNNAGYAILGIPSIIFGWILIKHEPAFKWPAWFLLLNGVACILGIIGIAGSVKALQPGSMVGGVLYLVTLILFTVVIYKMEYRST